MNADSMDAVFVALANPVRRRMLDILKDNPGFSVNDVCAYFEMSRIGVMKHLQILEAAKLVVSRKSGRTRHLFHNAVPIQMIYDRWTTEYSAIWAKKMTQIKYKIESNMPTEAEREIRSVRNRGWRTSRPAGATSRSKTDSAKQAGKQDNPSEKTE
ncbi:MAG TPA: metalloregulator ArsR/SmtB family transcription factor [Phycisphaerae bacterium]|nr:metalloregulator ArsR/SmtB family transcription factor [Phycisphaerae bacterium]